MFSGFWVLSALETLSQACLDFVFISLCAQCLPMFYWLFGVVFCDWPICLPLSSALSGYLPFAVILFLDSSSVTCIAHIFYRSLACLFTVFSLPFNVLRNLKKSPKWSVIFNSCRRLSIHDSNLLKFIFICVMSTILVFHINGAYQVAHVNNVIAA